MCIYRVGRTARYNVNHIMPSQQAFSKFQLILDEFATSLDLATTPNLRFLKEGSNTREEYRQKKNVYHK